MRNRQSHVVVIPLVLLLLTVSVSTVAAQPIPTRLHHLAGPNDGTQVLDVVLVHGLSVTPSPKARDTWTVGSDGKETWGDWLSGAIAGVRIHYLEYDASASGWAGKPMPLPARSTNILAVLHAKSIGRHRPVVFIGHSMGGLLTKQILRDASNKSEQEYGELADWTRGVVFLATPHAGASPAGFINRFLKAVKPSAAIKDLQPHDERLKELNQWYSNNSATLKIRTQAYSENQDTFKVRIVDPTSSDPGISNVTLTPVDANHLSITHPQSREDMPYLGVEAFVRSIVDGEEVYREQLKQQAQLVKKTVDDLIEQIEKKDEKLASKEQQLASKDQQINKLTKAVYELAIRESIPIEDWPKRLAEIAESFKAATQKINRYDGDDPEVRQFKEDAKEALVALSWREAEKKLGQAADRQLEIVRELGEKRDKNILEAAATMEEQALAVLVGFQYEKAGDHYQEAYELVREVSQETGIGYLNEAVVSFVRSGNYSKAEPVAKEAVTVATEVYEEGHRATATSLNNLAVLYREQGEYAKAEPLYEQSLEMRKKLLGEEHPEVAISLNNFAALYHSQGKHAKAAPLYEQALAMSRKLLGAEHPYVAISLNNLAALYQGQGEYAKAEPLFVEALAMYRKLLGEEHPDVALSLNNLAVLYQDQGEYAKADPLLEQSLAMYRKLLGDEHLDVAGSLNNLAGLYREQGEYAKAEPLYEKALWILKKTLSSDHPRIEIVEESLKLLRVAKGDGFEGEEAGED